jgi:hypothetical protein
MVLPLSMAKQLYWKLMHQKGVEAEAEAEAEAEEVERARARARASR